MMGLINCSRAKIFAIEKLKGYIYLCPRLDVPTRPASGSDPDTSIIPASFKNKTLSLALWNNTRSTNL